MNLSFRAFPNEISRAQEMMREFINRAMDLYRVLFNLNLESAYSLLDQEGIYSLLIVYFLLRNTRLFWSASSVFGRNW